MTGFICQRTYTFVNCTVRSVAYNDCNAALVFTPRTFWLTGDRRHAMHGTLQNTDRCDTRKLKTQPLCCDGEYLHTPGQCMQTQMLCRDDKATSLCRRCGSGSGDANHGNIWNRKVRRQRGARRRCDNAYRSIERFMPLPRGTVIFSMCSSICCHHPTTHRYCASTAPSIWSHTLKVYLKVKTSDATQCILRAYQWVSNLYWLDNAVDDRKRSTHPPLSDVCVSVYVCIVRVSHWFLFLSFIYVMISVWPAEVVRPANRRSPKPSTLQFSETQ